MQSPNIWGPIAWNFLNHVVMSYPLTPTNEDKINMKNFFINLGTVLPCNKCKLNYLKHLEKHPLDDTVLASRTNLIKWLIDIHNEVNKSTGKRVLTYEEGVKSMLEQYEGNGGMKWCFTIIVAIVFVIIIVVGGILKWKQ
jgi:hypothetical protein